MKKIFILAIILISAETAFTTDYINSLPVSGGDMSGGSLTEIGVGIFNPLMFTRNPAALSFFGMTSFSFLYNSMSLKNKESDIPKENLFSGNFIFNPYNPNNKNNFLNNSIFGLNYTYFSKNIIYYNSVGNTDGEISFRNWELTLSYNWMKKDLFNFRDKQTDLSLGVNGLLSKVKLSNGPFGDVLNQLSGGAKVGVVLGYGKRTDNGLANINIPDNGEYVGILGFAGYFSFDDQDYGHILINFEHYIFKCKKSLFKLQTDLLIESTSKNMALYFGLKYYFKNNNFNISLGIKNTFSSNNEISNQLKKNILLISGVFDGPGIIVAPELSLNFQTKDISLGGIVTWTFDLP